MTPAELEAENERLTNRVAELEAAIRNVNATMGDALHLALYPEEREQVDAPDLLPPTSQESGAV